MDSLLKRLYEIYSPSKGEKKMNKFIKKYARQFGCTIVGDNHNIYITKGNAETYPCIVAHTDQVQHLHSADFTAHDVSGMIIGASQKNRRMEGLGADDKNGIWVALKCLEKFDNIKCAFFWGEEIGCMGSEQAIMSFFDDCRFVLQCDRKGSQDFITDASWTELCSKEFVSACHIEDFGYAENRGMMTDVMTLKENGLKVCACNISCGYHEPHTDNEYTVISELENCLALVESIITNCTDVYPHEYEKTSYFGGGYTYHGYNYNSLYGGSTRTLSAHEQEMREMEYDELLQDLTYDARSVVTESAETLYSWYHTCYPHLTLKDYESAINDAYELLYEYEDFADVTEEIVTEEK